jgi:H+-transporting ATPase
MPDVSAKPPAGQSSPALSLDPAQVKISQRLETLKTTESGLTAAEAARRLAEYGPNALEDKTESKWRRLLNYFWGPLPFLIEAAAVISAVRRDWPDFGVVAGLLLYNAVVGFWQDNKAANALAALKKNLAPRARALRDGAWTTIPAAELTPGDIVSVAAGSLKATI